MQLLVIAFNFRNANNDVFAHSNYGMYHTCVRIHTYMCAYTYVYVCVYIRICVHMCTYMST